MTTRQAVEDAKLSESDQLRSGDFLEVTRREAIAVGAAGIAFLTNFNDLAQAAAESNTGAVSEQRSAAERQQQTISRADGNVPRTEQRPDARVEKYSDIMSLLGSEFRGRSSSIQTLTTHQLYGTGTREGPDRREVDAGAYFSNGFNRKLMSSSENQLATALRTRSEGINSVTRLSSEHKAALLAHLSQKQQQRNEGRAEVFFGAASKMAAKTVGAFVTGAAGKALNASTPFMAGLAGAGFTSVGTLFETPAQEAGEAFGRWLDPKIEQYKEGVKYDSRTDPRYNLIGGWPYD